MDVLIKEKKSLWTAGKLAEIVTNTEPAFWLEGNPNEIRVSIDKDSPGMEALRCG